MSGRPPRRARIPALVRRRAAGVALGLLLDRALGEPPAALHPVVWFGGATTVLERHGWADDRSAGVRHAALGLALGAGAGRLLEVAVGRAAAVPLAVAVAAAGRSLREAGTVVEERLHADDLAAARAALPALVGRDPSGLDAAGLSAAVVESLAENTVDAVVGPAFWALVAGAPGAWGYRAVNTMDAMVGHRSERYRRFGWAAARLDDAASWLPARVSAGLVALVRPWRAGAVVHLVARDAAAHPSPNAGVAETAMAAALGRELGGTLTYAGRTEHRPRLGGGPRPAPGDVARARAVADHAERALVVALLVTALGAAVPRRRSTR